MSGVFGRGLAAGAVGTTVLNGVTYLDMAVRGRPASEAPEQLVSALVDAVGTTVPGRGRTRDNRQTALGALAGIATGVLVGAAASVARAAGIRPPGPLAVLATGAAAMAASDIPLAAFGISDPHSWTAAEWVSDAVPHLAYGLAVHAVLAGRPHVDPPAAAVQRRPSAGLVFRSALLGLATGGRSSLGLAGPVLGTALTAGPLRAVTGPVGSSVAGLALVGELVADKLPSTPSRLDGPGLPMRLAAGAGGAVALARREGARTTLPLLAGMTGAAAGSYAGAAWRARSARRRPDWQGAVVEDVLALASAALACRSRPA